MHTRTACSNATFLSEEKKLLRRKLEEISRSNPLLKFNKSIHRSSVKILQRTWNYHTLYPSTSPTIFAYLFIFISQGKLANKSRSQESKKPCFKKKRLFRRNNWPRIIYPWASNRAIKLQIMLFVRIAITDASGAATNFCLTRACITRARERIYLPAMVLCVTTQHADSGRKVRPLKQTLIPMVGRVTTRTAAVT